MRKNCYGSWKLRGGVRATNLDIWIFFIVTVTLKTLFSLSLLVSSINIILVQSTGKKNSPVKVFSRDAFLFTFNEFHLPRRMR